MRIRTGITVAAAVVLTAGLTLTASAAGAATIPKGPHVKATVSGTTLKITDASKGSAKNGDFDNAISGEVKRDEGFAYITDEDSSLGIAGPGCTAGHFTEDTSAGRPEDTWAANWGPYQLKCSIAKVKKVDVNAGAGDDIVYVLLSPVPVSIEGGAGGDDLEYFSLDGDTSPPPYWSTSVINGGLGDDYLVGGRGNDTVIGDRGYDWVEGTCGADNLQGGSDDDSIDAFELGWGNMDCPAAKDIVNCGDGGDGADIDPGLDVVNVNCESTYTS